jgi:3-oxoacyl-[acyl-carrier protein] reductase
MNHSLKNKNALVCGASKGIGAAVAIELAELGANVTLVARDQPRLQAVQKKLNPSGQHAILPMDLLVTDDISTSIKQAIDVQGPFQILVCNAGGPPGGPIAKADVEEFEQAFRLHVLANQKLVQSVLPGMQSAGYGRIVNIISTSVKAPIANLGVSNTIRGAVASWSKTLAMEVAKDGITVNNVLPGFTQTSRLEQLQANAAQRLKKTTDEIYQQWLSQVPAGRLAQPEEVAAAVAFLASPAAGYINGINVPVDGGRTPCL